jgi:hypothetical protein
LQDWLTKGDEVNYRDYLKSKMRLPPSFGHEADAIHEVLFPFQAEICRWAIRRGRAAIFADCGLGKTLMQLEWARQSGDRILIAAPLAVAEQTIAEALKLGMVVRKAEHPLDGPGVQITNYEKLHHFIGGPYDGIVLDESGILKSLDGKTRTMLLREFTAIPRRLCCTATPAPNDLSELANHAEFLGVMSRVEMLASFFVHDSDQSGDGGWRLKGHAQDEFWKWVAKWSVYIRKPSDLGFDDGEFQLPRLTISQETVQADWKPEGMLFNAGLGGIGDRREARRETMQQRIDRAATIIRASGEQWLVWCGLNDEGDGLEEALGDDCVQIAGCDDDDDKISKERRWRSGEVRTLITKAKIFGFGMNWQHCHKQLFLGIGDSYEQYYQSIRRCWRFGQKRDVEAVIVVSDAEQQVADNVRRKELDAIELATRIVEHAKDAMRAEVCGAESEKKTYQPTKTMKLPGFLTTRTP